MPEINVVIVGASGAIGSTLTKQYAAKANHRVFAFSRTPVSFAETNVSTAFLDYNDESSIISAFETLNSIQPHVVIINNLTPLDTGHLIAWDGQKIDY